MCMKKHPPHPPDVGRFKLLRRSTLDPIFESKLNPLSTANPTHATRHPGFDTKSVFWMLRSAFFSNHFRDVFYSFFYCTRFLLRFGFNLCSVFASIFYIFFGPNFRSHLLLLYSDLWQILMNLTYFDKKTIYGKPPNENIFYTVLASFWDLFRFEIRHLFT